MGGLPPVFIEFLGNTAGVKTAIRGVETELAGVDAAGAGSFKKTGMMGKAAILGLGIAAVEVTKKTVGMAADFQTQMTRVRTGAGELQQNMSMVGHGVLAMAGQVGQSTSQLTSGLYLVESAGYHGANALTVLKTAAQGAKVGAADLGTTSDALTTAMNAYKMSAGQSTQAMNALIATEGQGKTNLEALAGSMSSILPTSAAAHVGLNEVLGAMATMTAQGTPAAVAATYLRQTIGMLSNPSAKAANEMKSLGLNSVQVAQNLGKNGLASTLNELTGAITQHMGPAGTVLIAHLQAAAKNTTAYQKVLANLPPAQQTYIGALATMVGGTKSMMAALQLTGPHMTDFQRNTKTIAEHVKAGGKSIEGWSDVQKTFNQKMAEAKASLGALGIQIGQYLMPYVQAFVGVLGTATTWLTQHKIAAEIAAGVIGGILVFALAAVTAQLYAMAAAAAINPVTWIVLGVMALIAAIVLLAMHWKQVWGGIKEATSATVNWLISAWHWLEDSTISIWHSITGGVTGAWNAVAAWFNSAWHTVTDPIVGAWHWLQSTTATVWNGITGFFKKWWPLLLVIFLPGIGLLIAIWNHFHDQITAVVTTVWNAVASFFTAVWGGIKTVASLVWTGIQVAIINPILAVWHTIQSVWHTISGWLSGAWHAIERTAGSIWGSIEGAMTGPLHAAERTISSTVRSIEHVISSGLHSAYNAVKGIGSDFLGVGKGIVDGIIHGVEHAGGALFGSLKHLAGGALDAAKNFLGINSPSKLFADHVGSSIPEGIALGVTSNGHLAHTAIRGVARGAVDAFSAELGIHSPSTVFRQLGIYLNEGLVAGLTGSTGGVQSATRHVETLLIQARNRLEDMLGTKAARGKRGAGLRAWVGDQEGDLAGVQSYVAREDAALRRLAANRDDTAKRLKTAQASLAGLQKQWITERNSVASGIMQGASIITASPDASRSVNSFDVVDQMRQKVAAAQQFAAELRQLQKEGLRTDLIQQLATAGVDQGGATALALSAGSKAQIQAMNQMQASLQGAASQTGSAVADSMYGAGIQSAKGLVKGLQSQEKAIDAQMLRIARSMQAAIKKALGIHSPSQVFADLGQFIPQGLAQGISAGAHHATAAVAALAGSVSAPGLGTGGTSAPGGGSVFITNNLTVQVEGHVVTDRQLVDVAQSGFLQMAARTGQSWAPYNR